MNSIEILIIEDTPITRDVLRGLIVSVFGESSYNGKTNIQHVSTLSDATKLLAKKTFNIIFLDIELPDGSGLDLIDGIKTEQPESAIVMVSGDSSTDSVTQAITKGVVGYVAKPFSRAGLQEAIKRAILFIEKCS